MSDVMVVSSKVKAFVSGRDFRTSQDFVEALSKKVEKQLAEAITKAQTAGRKTLKPEDLE